MQHALAPDLPRLALALAAAAIVFFSASTFATVAVFILAALLGLLLPSPAAASSPVPLHLPVSRTHGLITFGVFLALIVLLPPLAAISGSPALAHFNAFYRAGALVFGGGHVVLPLLERAVVAPGWVDPQSFLAGYGAAQAVPGPLFTFAAYLGAVLKDPATNARPIGLAVRAANSAAALAAIFLPGLLLMAAALPFWSTLGHNPRLRSALRAINASVVGILFAALVRPVATTAFHASTHIWMDAALVAAAFLALTRLKAAPWSVVLTVVLATAALSNWH